MTNFWPQSFSDLITRDKIGQSCTMFPKPRVCQSLFKVPNPANPLVQLPGQV